MASAEETVNNQEGAADIDEDQIDDGVAIDHNEAVDDSALGSDWGSSTNSLSSSVLNYTYENGRRYHSFRAGNYFMPNDEQEQDSMDLWHHISTMILEGELFRAPIKDPRQILEIGTGTGIWAIDVADKYPLATVDATDLSPIQPTWVPPNLQFHVDDCESPWDFGVKFDFIHMRNLSGSIADWPKLLDQAYAALRPGGWIEVSNIEAWGQSYNNSLPKDSASTEWQENLRAAASTSGRELNVGPLLYQLITAAGFVNVQDDKQKIPMSAWMPEQKKSELAHYFYHLVSSELEGLSLALYTRVLGWTAERLQALLALVREEIRDQRYQMYSEMHYVYGQKPEN